jgi:cell division control protein 6
MASILVEALTGGTPSNIFVYGLTGTGKTAVTQFVGKALEKKANEITKHSQDTITSVIFEYLDEDTRKLLQKSCNYLDYQALLGEELNKLVRRQVNFIYINCHNVDTQYRVLAHIANHFIKEWDDRIPFTGWPTDEVYDTLLEYIDREGGVTTIVLDEIDKLVGKSGDDVLYNLSRINNDLKQGRVNIICITNNVNFRELLDARVRSSLSEEEIIFPPYDAAQLQDILYDRVKLAFADGVLDDTVVPLCAARAAQEHGDARRALDLLRVAAELAERHGANQVTEDFVRRAERKIELDHVNEVIRKLPHQPKLVLLSVLLTEKAGDGKNTTGEIFETYSELCRKLNMTRLGQKRVTDLISQLDTLGIINTRIVSFGRARGRTTIIEMAVPHKNILKVLSEDEMLADVIHYKPQTQQTLI